MYSQHVKDYIFHQKTGIKTEEEFATQKKFYTSKKFQQEITTIRQRIQDLEAKKNTSRDPKEKAELTSEITAECVALSMREKTRKLFSGLKFPKIPKKYKRQMYEIEKVNVKKTETEEQNTRKELSDWAQEGQKSPYVEPISAMSWKALTSMRTMGSIEPPLKGGFSTGLKEPLPNGFKKIPPSRGEMQVMPAIQVGKTEETIVRFPVQKSTNAILPCPVDSEICAFGEEDGLALTTPTTMNPLTWQSAEYLENEAVYAIRQKTAEQKIDPIPFIPSPEEQAYWKKMLPLDEEVVKACQKEPDLTAEYIAGFIRKRFVYVCHDELGKLFREHADDLPLLMDELKMGHCDLLSWATCVYLRQMGLPAVVENERVTSKDGKSFMADYSHARVVLIQTNGKPLFIDPTVFTEMPKSWTPERLPSEVVEKLSADLADTEEEQQKRKILRKFLEQHPIHPEDFEKKPSPWESQEFSTLISDILNMKPVRETKEERILTNLHVENAKSPREVKKYIAEIFDGMQQSRELEFLETTGVRELPQKKGTKKILQQIALLAVKAKTPLSWKLRYNFNKEFNELPQDNIQKWHPEDWKEIVESNSIADLEKTGFWMKNSELYENPKSIYKHIEGFTKYYSERLYESVPLFHLEKEFKKMVNYFLLGRKIKLKKDTIYYDAQAFYFWQLLVKSFKDQSAKEHLKKYFDLDEKDIRTLAKKILRTHGEIPPPKQEMSSFLHWQSKFDLNASKKYIEQMKKIYEYPTEKVALFQKKVFETIQSCDLQRRRSRKEPEGFTSRPAVEGDDARKIDWRVFARTDKFHVRTAEVQQTHSSPLHVVFGITEENENLCEQIALTIYALQKSMRKERREIWISGFSLDYYKLKAHDDPFLIAALLFTDRRTTVSKEHTFPQVNTRKGPPKNLLVFGNHDGKLEALKFLMKDQCNIVTANYMHDELYLPILVRDKWVNEAE